MPVVGQATTRGFVNTAAGCVYAIKPLADGRKRTSVLVPASGSVLESPSSVVVPERTSAACCEMARPLRA